MITPLIDRLDVPGASLNYEVRGNGPTSLMIPGGNGDAGPYTAVVELLAERYTVVTYDRRGFSRSPLHGPIRDDQRLEIDGDDARRLIDRLAGAPPSCSAAARGAIVALDLLTRRPGQVQTLIAHEPPLVTASAQPVMPVVRGPAGAPYVPGLLALR